MNKKMNKTAQTFTPCFAAANPLASLPPLYGADSDGEIRTCYILMIVDTSGSMSPYEAELYQSVSDTLSALAKKNASSEDVEFRVCLVSFNNTVNVITNQPLPPEQLSELLDASTFHCSGGTNLTAIVDYVDQQFTRSGTMMQHLHTGDPKSFTVIVTDMCGTDSASTREAAINKLTHNRLYTNANQTLCVFTGPDSKKRDAVVLAGSEDNIIALNGELSTFLTPIMLKGTLSMTDATHVGGSNTTQSSSEIAGGIRARTAEGNNAGNEITRDSDALNAEISRLLGL